MEKKPSISKKRIPFHELCFDNEEIALAIEVIKPNLIMVVPTPDVAMSNQEYVYQYSFSGGGMNNLANPYAEYKADMATFDIDRPPYGNFPGPEDTNEIRNIPQSQQFRMITNIGAQISGKSIMGDKVFYMGVVSADPSIE